MTYTRASDLLVLSPIILTITIMNSNPNTLSDGHFPYGDQPDYRNFLIPSELEAQFRQMNEHNRESSDPLIIAKYFNPV